MAPPVDVVIVAYNRHDLTETCIEHLAEQTLPHNLILVDNGSTDGTAERVRALRPSTELLRLERNSPFAVACNLGVKAGSAEVVVLLNNDVECRPQYLESAVAPLAEDPAVGSVTTLMLQPGEALIDSFGMSADPTLAGFLRLHGHPVADAQSDDPVLAGPPGTAAAYRRTAWEEIGGLDERIFAYGEDFDLALRLRAAGWTAAVAPDAVGVHLGVGHPWPPLQLPALQRRIRAGLSTAPLRRAARQAGPAGAPDGGHRRRWRPPHLARRGGAARTNRRLARRARPAAPPAAATGGARPQDRLHEVTGPAPRRLRQGDSLNVATPRVLFICMDPVGGAMAGQGIRCVELARALGPRARSTIAAPGFGGPLPEGIAQIVFSPHAPRALREPIAQADLVFAPPQWPVVDRWLAHSPAQVVFDLYDPEALETLELFSDHRPAMRRLMLALTLDRLDDALRTGDRFVCASETQRDLWLGALMRSRAITPQSYDGDPTLRSLIDTLPSGVPDEPPSASFATGPRAQFGAIGERDHVVLWNGGIWRWLDAPTAIRAVAALAERRGDVRLVFMGASTHPAAATAGREARALAESLGLLGSVVFFHDQWVPYEERGAWLLQADCALSTHRDHVEARFAWRTRIVDCFWAGLPVVCTEGDDLAERVSRERLGATAPAGDVEALAAAIDEVLERGRDHYIERCREAAATLTWARVSGPLARWIGEPARASHTNGRGERVPRTAAHRLRRAAYLAGGRVVLARRAALRR